METFRLIRDDHVKIWRRTYFDVQSESLEKAIELVKQEDGEVIHSELLYETEEILEPTNEATTEIMDEHNNIVYSNL